MGAFVFTNEGVFGYDLKTSSVGTKSVMMSDGDIPPGRPLIAEEQQSTAEVIPIRPAAPTGLAQIVIQARARVEQITKLLVNHDQLEQERAKLVEMLALLEK